MQICTLTQTHNHTSISPLSFYGPDALPAAQGKVCGNLGKIEHPYFLALYAAFCMFINAFLVQSAVFRFTE